MLAGRYRVDALIGSGGMGSVYRAHQLDGRADVALKIFRPDRLGDAGAVRRFFLEARATSALRGRHAARTFEIERLDNGVPFIVMELLEGADLSATLKARGPLPVDTAVRYIVDACDGLAEAHGLSIIHRDLKPANLFVTTDGVLKVLDFGLAKILPALAPGPENNSEATQARSLLGSPHYMSPEQLRSARDVDARADVWSLGATLFHLLSGDPPFFGLNLYMLIGAIMNTDAPRLSTRLPSAPPALDDVVAKCLRRAREERFASCVELRRALLNVLDSVHPADLADPTRPRGRQDPMALRRLATTLAAPEADDEPSTMDVPVAPQARPPMDQTLQSPQGLASFADPIDDVDPTVVGTDARPSPLPKLYDDDPLTESHDQPGTMLMAETVGRLLAQGTNPGAPPPRVYDDDVELLPEVTKLMLGSAPHLRAALAAAEPAWKKNTVPLAAPLAPPPPAVRAPPPGPPLPPPAPLVSAPAPVAKRSNLWPILVVTGMLLALVAILAALRFLR